MILGAIIGDIVGAPYEFNRKGKVDETTFPLFTKKSHFSDDTVHTIAIMDFLLGKDLLKSVIEWSEKFPEAGYGGMFRRWLYGPDQSPYGSFGNGSAMRVSPVAWYAKAKGLTLEACLDLAELTSSITHNHPEGIKGAQSVAACIYLALSGMSKEEIKNYVTEKFGYNLDRTVAEIRPNYKFDSTCQGSVPEAIICFLEANSYEEAIRKAVSLGGDTDTQADIAGAIAEAYFGIPEDIQKAAMTYLPKYIKEVITTFSNIYETKARTSSSNS